MAPTSVALILGAGPRIGSAVAEKFASNGYKVALASRNGTGNVNDKGFLSLKADFANPDSVTALFDAVETEFLSSPNVVVYNAGSLTSPPDKDSVLSIPADSVVKDLIVNTVSPYVAAQKAVEKWAKMPHDVKKTFIYTGNITNVAIVPMPMMLNVGMGKAAAAYWLGAADQLYSGRTFRSVLYAQYLRTWGVINIFCLLGSSTPMKGMQMGD